MYWKQFGIFLRIFFVDFFVLLLLEVKIPLPCGKDFLISGIKSIETCSHKKPVN